jgi:tetratricopeptide (TPR) repeat protein
MKKTSSVMIILLFLLVLAGQPIAAETVDLDALSDDRAEKQERYYLRALTQKRMNAANELLEAGQFAQARVSLEKLNPARLNVYERALVYRLLAYAAVGQEDSAGAIYYFDKVIGEEVLTIEEESSARFSVAQIYASLEDWEKAEETLDEWFRYIERPNGGAYYLLAIARYQQDRYDEALEPALKAIEVSAQAEERWLQLVAALYLEKEDFDSAVPILEELVTGFTKKQYWLQLSLIYGARGDYEHALRVQQLAYAQGLLTEDEELRRFARTYLFHQLPYPAARVLERGLDEGAIEPDRQVLELLGNAWIAAREYERSIEPLERAANLSEDGRLFLRLGQVRVQREDWKEATELIQKALEKGGLDDLGKAHMLLGISLYGDGRADQATTAFSRARTHESTREEATAWLEHLARQSQDG